MAREKTYEDLVEENRSLRKQLREYEEENVSLADRLNQIGDLASEEEEGEREDDEYFETEAPPFDDDTDRIPD